MDRPRVNTSGRAGVGVYNRPGIRAYNKARPRMCVRTNKQYAFARDTEANLQSLHSLEPCASVRMRILSKTGQRHRKEEHNNCSCDHVLEKGTCQHEPSAHSVSADACRLTGVSRCLSTHRCQLMPVDSQVSVDSQTLHPTQRAFLLNVVFRQIWKARLWTPTGLAVLWACPRRLAFSTPPASTVCVRNASKQTSLHVSNS